MQTFLVTGGAGFIGSNIVAALSRTYPNAHIAVCDYMEHGEKWRNLAGCPPDEVFGPQELLFWLESNNRALDGIIHMGALSATTQTDGDAANEINVSLPKILSTWCAANDKRFIYASSASVYGGGEHGFDDTHNLDYLRKLTPLNLYAWSKYMFDFYMLRQSERGAPMPRQWAGLRFFNVFGPNEYHKGGQQSVISGIYPDVAAGKPVSLFKSHHPDYADGGQLRDFIYVRDCVNVILWLLENPSVSGIYNVGTGQARSFADLATALFKALGKDADINYIDMPESLRPRYQYYTKANMTKLHDAGYNIAFTTLEDGVRDYAQRFLHTENPYIT